jgi:hypothetical protein
VATFENTVMIRRPIEELDLRRGRATGGRTFKKGAAVVTAEVFGCNEAVCGSETDTEVIEIQR